MLPENSAETLRLRKLMIGVIGAGRATEEGYRQAMEVGGLLAEQNAVLICGGLGGVMEGACRGCSNRGGEAVGILPGGDASDANPYVTLAIPTNMGHARNIIIAHSAQALIAIEGEYGTLSEMAVALKLGRPVIALNSWPNLDGVIYVKTAQEAAAEVFARVGWGHSSLSVDP